MAAHRIIAVAWAMVEHPFRIIQRQFGHAKTRSRTGLPKKACLSMRRPICQALCLLTVLCKPLTGCGRNALLNKTAADSDVRRGRVKKGKAQFFALGPDVKIS